MNNLGDQQDPRENRASTKPGVLHTDDEAAENHHCDHKNQESSNPTEDFFHAGPRGFSGGAVMPVVLLPLASTGRRSAT
jgi:hypothetical protein